MAYVDWQMKGPELGNCNCDYGCPCQFNAMPTQGSCEGNIIMRIDEGHFGDVRLDGLNWVMMYHWPGAIHEGGGEVQPVIDERADAAQRQALETILHGKETEPGATMLQVFSTTVDKVHETLYRPIEFEVDVDGRTGRVSIPDLLEVSGQPIRNPVTGDEHRVLIEQPNGFEFTKAEIGSASTKATGVIPLDLKDSYGQFAHIHLTQNGVVH